MAETPVKMKAVIFAGGVGTRMWPLSRKKSPKQFEPIIDNQSTLQMAVSRLRPEFDWHDIYISTGEIYRDIIEKQLPDIPKDNIIGEPQMRDVAPAVGYLMGIIAKKSPNTPTVILWSDHLVERENVFKKAIFAGGKYVQKNPHQYVFLGQRPRFANQNLGWIGYGKTLTSVDGFELKEFKTWHYRPDLNTAVKYFKDNGHAWNPGYFVLLPEFVLKQYQAHTPQMYQILLKLQESYGTADHTRLLSQLYPSMEKISFDDAIITKATPDQAVVISVDMGWSDIGTWDALKEALQNYPSANITHGQVKLHETTNSLVYNYTPSLVTTVDVSDMVVVATPDAILVTRQQSIPKIKDMLKSFEDTDLEKYS